MYFRMSNEEFDYLNQLIKGDIKKIIIILILIIVL